MFDALMKGAMESLITVMGDEALFYGTTPSDPIATKINLERDVKFTGYEDTAQYKGETTVSYNIATISKDVPARAGAKHYFRFVDAEGLPTGPKWRLEKKMDDNGFNPRFVVLEVEA